MKFYILFSLIISAFSIAEKVQNWCWTKPMKPSEKKLISPSNGGPNWGFCGSGSAKDEKIPYRVYVETSNIVNSGANGNFYITLYGEEGKSEEILLTSNGFVQGSTTIVKIIANNIGDVNKIRLKNGG